MFVGIYSIFFGALLLVIGMRWADNMAKNFRKSGSEVDPAYFKVAIGGFGLAAIIFGIVKLTAALR